MAEEQYESLQVYAGAAVAPSRDFQIALFFELGRSTYFEMSDDDLRSSFIFNYHLSSLDDIIRKGVVEFSSGGLRLSNIGISLHDITFAISNPFLMLDHSGLVQQLTRNIDDLPNIPDFYYRWQRKRLVLLRAKNQKKP